MSVWYIYRSVRLDVGLLPEAGAAWARGIRERMRRNFRDERREIHSTHSMQGKLAVWMCLGFGYFYSVLGWDLSMSLDLHYNSTLYSWWWFMGAWLGALMSWSLLCMWWRRYLNAYDLIKEVKFHDLGKLCFAFTAFWGYFTFGQYLVNWYGNLAEETHWQRLRLIEPYLPIGLAVVFLIFVIPFFGLVSRAAKVYLPTFIAFASASLVGLWLLRFLEVYPSIHGVEPSLPLGIWEIGVTVGFLGMWGASYAAFMNAFPRMRVVLMTSQFRDEVQVPVNRGNDGAAPGSRVVAEGGRRVPPSLRVLRAAYLSTRGALAQLGEHSVCNRKVASSSLARSILFSTDRLRCLPSARRSNSPAYSRNPRPPLASMPRRTSRSAR